jgi:hypothetical protein
MIGEKRLIKATFRAPFQAAAMKRRIEEKRLIKVLKAFNMQLA